MASKDRKTKKAYKNKTKGKRGRKTYNSRFTTISKCKSLITNRFMTKMEYCHNIGTYSFAGGAAPIWWQYRSNGLYDPEITGIGHQPMGFDQFELFYIRNRVHAVKMTVIARTVPETAENTQVALLIGQYRDTLSTPNDLSEADEDRQYDVRYVNDQEDLVYSKMFYPRDALGLTKEQYNTENDTSGTWTNLPSKAPVLNLGLTRLSATPTPPRHINLKVHLTYFCELYQPRKLSPS